MTRLVVAFFVTLALLLGGTLALGRFVLQAPPDDYWAGALVEIKKHEALAVDRPKIVIVGGSGALFGINAELIEKSTGIPTVNLATHVALGPGYHLHVARQVIEPHDIVLLAFEYHSLLSYLDASPLLLLHILFFDPSYLLERPALFWRVVLGWGFWRTFDDTYTHYTRGEFQPPWPYVPQAITEHGDIDWSQENPPSNREQIRASPPYAPIMPNSREAVEALSRFVEDCARHDIRAIVVWPNVVEKPEYRTELYGQYFAALARFYKSIGLEVVGSPEDAFLTLDEMLDTIVHPTSAGSMRRTRLLIKALRDAHVVPSSRQHATRN